jgi:phage-related protein
LGDSSKTAHRFPKGVRLKLGKELTRIQLGAVPRHGKALANIGHGVQEVRIAHDTNAFRVIYVAVFLEAIYVLHAFQKKSKTGSATPQEEFSVARRRYRELVHNRRLI